MIPMKKIIRFVFFIMLAVIVFKCASSSLNIVELNLNPQRDTVIEIMPFSEAKKRLASRGFKWRGAIVDLIDRETGLYTSFDDEDYANLRQSLIQSLRRSQIFKAINDIQNENVSANGIRLYISFDESGINQTSLESFCVLNAYAWTEIEGDSVLSKKEIKTKGRSNWSASGAKNDAITKFIKEVAQLISIKSK
jgi:hypothetical protein